MLQEKDEQGSECGDEWADVETAPMKRKASEWLDSDEEAKVQVVVKKPCPEPIVLQQTDNDKLIQVTSQICKHFGLYSKDELDSHVASLKRQRKSNRYCSLWNKICNKQCTERNLTLVKEKVTAEVMHKSFQELIEDYCNGTKQRHFFLS